MKIPWFLVLIELFMLGVVGAYMASFPVFPEVRSADFASHIGQSGDLAHGIIPPLSGQLLYYGVEYYLAGWQRLFPSADPFVIVRWAMALLIIVSPIVVFLSMRKVFVKEVDIITLTYVLSGAVWVEMVMISGLFANFYGVLSSLALVGASFWLAEGGFSAKKLGVYALVLVNALFSHYSTLLVFPPLAGYMGWKWLKAKPADRLGPGFVLAGLAGLPALGILFYPGLLHGLLGFLAPTASIVSQPTVLSPFLAVPSVQFLAEQLTDYGFLFLSICLVAFFWFGWKRKDPKMVFLLAWFLLPLAVAPWNSSAWRFSMASLLPGTLIMGYVLSKVPKFPFMPKVGPSHAKRGLFFLLLIAVPLFYPSWTLAAVNHSILAPPSAQEDPNVYAALRWIGANIREPLAICSQSPQDPQCPHMVSVTDWRFGYSPLFGGPMVLYGPDYGVIVTDPDQVQFFAAHNNSTYLIVTDALTYGPLSCSPEGSLGLTMTANETQVAVGQHILLSVTAARGLSVSGKLYDNGRFVAIASIRNGSAAIEASYSDPGRHSLFLMVSDIATLPLSITVGPNPAHSPQEVTVPPDYCLPWRTFNYGTLIGWTLVYQNPDVKVWEAPKS